MSGRGSCRRGQANWAVLESAEVPTQSQGESDSPGVIPILPISPPATDPNIMRRDACATLVGACATMDGGWMGPRRGRRAVFATSFESAVFQDTPLPRPVRAGFPFTPDEIILSDSGSSPVSNDSQCMVAVAGGSDNGDPGDQDCIFGGCWLRLHKRHCTPFGWRFGRRTTLSGGPGYPSAEQAASCGSGAG